MKLLVEIQGWRRAAIEAAVSTIKGAIAEAKVLAADNVLAARN